MTIDSHTHINSIVLDDIQKCIDNINENSSIEGVINVGLDVDSSMESVLISKTNSKFYSTIGIHPLYIESQKVDFLYQLADNEKVVAVGEVGLDPTKNNFIEQKKYLIK